jgi:uncharacterized membrane protein YoaK (UPF0700 family)
MARVSEAARLRFENLSLGSLSFGCIGVLSFLGLGDVFMSAMTGNTALRRLRGAQQARRRSSSASSRRRR